LNLKFAIAIGLNWLIASARILLGLFYLCSSKKKRSVSISITIPFDLLLLFPKLFFNVQGPFNINFCYFFLIQKVINASINVDGMLYRVQFFNRTFNMIMYATKNIFVPNF